MTRTDRRPMGVTLISMAALAVAAWSFAAAALPGVFFGGTIPLYPPLNRIERRMIGGAATWIGAGLTERQQTLALFGVGAVLTVLALLLWRRVRHAQVFFIGAIWAAAGYYVLAFVLNRPLWLVAREVFDRLRPPLRFMILCPLALLLLTFILVTVYLWRRRDAFG